MFKNETRLLNHYKMSLIEKMNHQNLDISVEDNQEPNVVCEGCHCLKAPDDVWISLGHFKILCDTCINKQKCCDTCTFMKKNDPDLPAQHKLELMGSNETIGYLHQAIIEPLRQQTQRETEFANHYLDQRKRKPQKSEMKKNLRKKIQTNDQVIKNYMERAKLRQRELKNFIEKNKISGKEYEQLKEDALTQNTLNQARSNDRLNRSLNSTNSSVNRNNSVGDVSLNLSLDKSLMNSMEKL